MMSYPKEIQEIKERFYRQSYETLYDNYLKLKGNEIVNAFNKNIDISGYSSCLTTRPDGFKTSVLVVVKQ